LKSNFSFYNIMQTWKQSIGKNDNKILSLPSKRVLGAFFSF
jgi:hypothetical protein